MKQITANEIMQRFPKHLKLLFGSSETKCSQPCSPTDIHESSIVFANTKEAVQSALASKAAIIVIPEQGKDLLHEDMCRGKTILMSPQITLAMAFCNKEFFDEGLNRTPLGDKSIHPSAVIAESAKLGNNVKIGPNAVIYDHVIIGDNTYIGANSVIEARTHIGNDCHIHAQVFIGHSSLIGNRCEIQPNSSIATEGFGYAQDENGVSHRIPHMGRVVLEDDVHLGANVNIDRGTYGETKIGRGTKFDNHCHVAHNVHIGEDCLVTAGFIVAGSTKIGDRCRFGGRAGIVGHIEVCSDVTVAPQSSIIASVTEPGMYAGYPHQPINDWKRSQAIVRALPKLKKQITDLEKKVEK